MPDSSMTYSELSGNITRKVNDNLYYLLVGIVSLVSLLFLPALGTAMELGWSFPATAAGWLVFIVSKLMVAALNVIIFHSFVKQARLNIKNDPNYREAITILARYHEKEYRPRSLAEFNKQEYRSKLTTIAITSIISAFSLSQALLTFDWMSFLSYLFTVVMGIVWGILEMKKYEDFYTGEFLDNARFIQRLKEEEKSMLSARTASTQPIDNQELPITTENDGSRAEDDNDTGNLIGGTSILVSSNSDRIVGLID